MTQFMDAAQTWLLQPSGLNDQPYPITADFQQYITATAQMIQQARGDLNGPHCNEIVTANSPFECLPSSTPSASGRYRNGILLVHGLFTSPFFTRDLANKFSEAGFLVRSILLPGHGTRPADLLNVRYQAWQTLIESALDSLQTAAENLYVVGISAGATLVLQQALRRYDLKKIVLFVPAIQLATSWAWLLKVYPLIDDWLPKRFKWYARCSTPMHHVQYDIRCLNAAAQLFLLIEEIQREIQNKIVHVPTFIAATSDDEVVSTPAIINFFQQHLNGQSRLLLYSNDTFSFSDARITVHPSVCMEHNILDFSHPCLTISPDHPYLGYCGSYQDFKQDRSLECQTASVIYQGAVHAKNLKRGRIQRLSYNPYFEAMMQDIVGFLETE